MPILVGIDWAKDWNDLCAMRTDGSLVIRSLRFAQTPQAFAEVWQKLIAVAGTASEVWVGIERPHGVLVEFLLQQGARVFPLNPKAVDRARDRHRASVWKDDEFDAYVIADVVRTDHHRLQALEPDSPIARELKGLSRDRDDLVGRRTELLNKLQASLCLYYAAALTLFGNLESAISLRFLIAFPEPAAARRLSRSQLLKWLKKNSYTHPHRIEAMYALLQQPPLPADPVTVRVESLRIRQLAQELLILDAAIDEYERLLKALYEKHPDHDIFNSFPGAGPVLGPKIAAELGGETMKRMATDQVRARAGTAPATISTGKRSKGSAIVVFRRACSKPLRAALQLYAMASVRRSRWAAAFVTYHKAQGHKAAETYRALADKWVAIFKACLRSGKPYEEELYIRAIAGRANWASGLLPQALPAASLT